VSFNPRNILLAASAGYLLLATFPGEYRPVGHGLDESWIYAINTISSSQFRFGRDVVFTSGPLGFLIYPLDIGSNLPIAIGFWLAVHVVFAFLLLQNFRSHRAGQALIFVTGYVLSLSLGLRYEFHLLLVLGLALTSYRPGHRQWSFLALGAGAIAAILLFVKFSIGVAALAMVLIASTWWLLGKAGRKARILAVALPIVSYIATLTVFGLILTGSVRDLLRWLRLSGEISRGYSVAMGVEEVWGLAVLGLVGTALLFVFIGVLRLASRDLAWILLIFSPAIFVAFKNSFVRHHGRLFFPFVLAVASILVLRTTKKALTITVVGFAALATVALMGSSFQACHCALRARVIAAKQGVEHLIALVRFEEFRKELSRQSERQLTKSLPPHWVSQLRQSDVDVVPWEISITASERLDWMPNPVLQTYSAYTRELDALSASHYRGQHRPRYLLVRLIDIDRRHPFIATPQTWRAILAGYEAKELDPGTGLLLLEPKPRQLTLQYSSRSQARLGSWVHVPINPAVANLDLRLRPIGHLAAFFWRIPPIYLDIEFEDSTRETHRMIPETSAAGVLISPLPRSQDDLMKMLNTHLHRPVERIQIRGAGTAYYYPETSIVWRELRIKP
jgi:hypothetical protein